MKAMDESEPELTEAEANDLLDGDEQDAGWDADDEYGPGLLSLTHSGK
jgi:hypothetical protein